MTDCRRSCLLLVALCLSFATLSARADLLDSLKPEHPRILAHESDFARIKKLVATDDIAKRWYAALKERGEDMLQQPAARYELRDGRRLLYLSGEVLRRVQTLAMLDRIQPDDRYRDRVWADLKAIAAFDHWNPDHFLDVAVMAQAFAQGYDWLYDRWTDEQRAVIRLAIVRHAIEPGLIGYKENAFWTRTHSNWNQVCNGGLINAALAIADEEPTLAADILAKAVRAIQIPMTGYAPDGGYAEGPGYWAFGTGYNVYATAALQSALGSDLGLGDAPGFAQTGAFPVQMTGNTGLMFNFGDNKEKDFGSTALLYFAKRYNQPGTARFAIERSQGAAMDLLWYDPALVRPDQPKPPLGALYRNAGVAALRSGWDTDDWYIGAKGGRLGFGHAQMDLGSFILEHGGVRWLIDLGRDDYNLDGYFASYEGGKRWDYYRNRAEGHNTLVVNADGQPDQAHDAVAPVELEDNRIGIDLSSAYGGRVTRTIALQDKGKRVRVVDTLAFDEPADVWWFAHTRAQVQLSEDGRSAALTQAGRRMVARLVSPRGAVFSVMDARPLPSSPDPPGQDPNNGAAKTNNVPSSSFVRRGELPRYGQPDPARAVRKLAIRLQAVTDERVEVVFEPGDK